jgi:phosphohistidine phosphatase
MGDRKLYLLRHAQTLDSRQEEKDIYLMLTPIGFQNANRMGMNLKNKQVQPDIIICSAAIRTQQTAESIAEHVSYDSGKVHINSEVYDASIRTLLHVVNNLKDEWQTVVLIGHNPSITYLAEYITGEAVGNMSTCGLVSIDFNLDSWQEVSEGNGDFKFYEYPAQLNF